MRREYKRLFDVLEHDTFGAEGVTHQGIFQTMYEYTATMPIPFTEDECITMDELLPWQYGERIVTPYLMAFTDSDGMIPEASPAMVTLSHSLWNMFHVKWEHLYALYEAEYNPISNYDMTETESTEAETESVVEGTSQRSGSTSTGDNFSTYGFNSAAAVPRDANTGSGTSSEEEEDGQETTGSAVGSRNLTRSGNIGVTTTQQMMTQEIELWKWNLLRSVLKDVVDTITLPIF